MPGGLAQRGPLFMPGGGLLVRVSDLQDGLFTKWFAQQLQPDWQPRRTREATRHTQPADAGEVRGYRVNIHKIHLQWVIALFADLERRSRGNRRDNRVDLAESV